MEVNAGMSHDPDEQRKGQETIRESARDASGRKSSDEISSFIEGGQLQLRKVFFSGEAVVGELTAWNVGREDTRRII